MFLALRKQLMVNFATGRLSIAGHIIILCRDKNKCYVASYVMVYKAMSHVMLPHMHGLSPAPTLVACNKWMSLSQNPCVICNANETILV
jgi:hypothetical protein